MFAPFRALFSLIFVCFRPRTDLVLENLALRQQLQVLNRRRPKPRMTPPDRFYWVTLRRLWSSWKPCADYRRAGDGRTLASCRVQTVLEPDIAAPGSSRQETDE